jgi:sterol desaturase/sphingolipid hydroxylase (fatty acid hydroxylase superfamily)
MEKYLSAFWEALKGTASWTWDSITFDVPWYTNYFWGLIAISLVAWALEIAFPWRKDQKLIRKDFWLDGFYMFFNFFVFSIFISGFYKLIELGSASFGVSMKSISLLDLSALPVWSELLIFFILLDFVQWFTHVLLHRYPILWNFHKVHHSVKEMGFAAHLRYHWMENVLYKPLKTLVVMLIGGFEPEQAYIIHFIAIAIGHLNHANIKLTYGPLKYIFNNPVMHLHHHAYALPEGSHGVNYAISLSLWDYIFKTAYIPNEDGHTKLGFEGDENFPQDFIGQNLYGFGKKD